jgi:hypothetical protein
MIRGIHNIVIRVPLIYFTSRYDEHGCLIQRCLCNGTTARRGGGAVARDPCAFDRRDGGGCVGFTCDDAVR